MCRVCHLARQLLESLQRRHNDELDLTDEDILCVQMAGLCHDLGECGCVSVCCVFVYICLALKSVCEFDSVCGIIVEV